MASGTFSGGLLSSTSPIFQQRGHVRSGSTTSFGSSEHPFHDANSRPASRPGSRAGSASVFSVGEFDERNPRDSVNRQFDKIEELFGLNRDPPAAGAAPGPGNTSPTIAHNVFNRSLGVSISRNRIHQQIESLRQTVLNLVSDHEALHFANSPAAEAFHDAEDDEFYDSEFDSVQSLRVQVKEAEEGRASALRYASDSADKYKEVQKSLDEANSLLVQFRGRLEEAHKEARATVEKELDDANSRAETEKSHRSALEHRIADAENALHSDIADYKAEIQKLKDKLERKQTAAAQESSESHQREMQSSQDVHRKEVEDLKASHLTAQQEHETTLQRLKDEHEAKLKSKDEEIADLNKNHESAALDKDRNAELSRSQLELALTAKERHARALTFAKERAEKSLETAKTEHARELESVKADHLKTADEAKAKYSEDLSALQRRIDSAGEEHGSLRDRHSGEITAMQSKVDETMESHARLEAELKQAREANDSLKQQHAQELSTLQKDLESGRSSHGDTVATHTREVSQLQGKLDEAERAHKKTKAQHAVKLEELQRSFESVQQGHDSKIKELTDSHVDALQKAKEAGEAKVSAINAEMDAIRVEHEKHQKQHSDAVAHITNSRRVESAWLQQQLHDIKTAHANQVEDLSKSHEIALSSKQKALEELQDNHQQKSKQHAQELERHVSTSKDSRKRVEYLSKQLEQTRKDALEMAKSLSEEHGADMHKLQDRIHELEGQVQETEKAYQTEILEFKNAIMSDLDTARRRHEEHSKSLQERAVTDLHDVKQKHRTELDKLQFMLSEMQTSHEQALAKAKEASTQELSAARKAHEDTKRDLVQMEQSHASAVAEAKMAAESLKVGKDEQEGEAISQLQKHLEDLKSQHALALETARKQADDDLATRDKAHSEVVSKIRKDAEDARLRHESTFNNMKQELANSTKRHVAEVGHLRQASRDAVREIETAQNEYTRQAQEENQQHTETITALRKEVEEAKKKLDRVTRENKLSSKAMNQQHLNEITALSAAAESAQKEHQEALQTSQRDWESKAAKAKEDHEMEMATLRSEHNGKIFRMESEHEKALSEAESATTSSANQKVESEQAAKFSELEQKHQATIRDLEAEHTTKLSAHAQQIRDDLIRQHEEATKQLQSSKDQRINELEAETNKHKKDVSTYEERIEAAEKELAALKAGSKAEADTQKQELQEALKEAQEQRAEADKKLTGLTAVERERDAVISERMEIERANSLLTNEVANLKKKTGEMETARVHAETALTSINQQMSTLQQKFQDVLQKKEHAEKARDQLLTRSSSLSGSPPGALANTGHRRTSKSIDRNDPLERPMTASGPLASLADPDSPDKTKHELRAMNSQLLRALNDLRSRHEDARKTIVELRAVKQTDASRPSSSARPSNWVAGLDLEAARERVRQKREAEKMRAGAGPTAVEQLVQRPEDASRLLGPELNRSSPKAVKSGTTSPRAFEERSLASALQSNGTAINLAATQRAASQANHKYSSSDENAGPPLVRKLTPSADLAIPPSQFERDLLTEEQRRRSSITTPPDVACRGSSQQLESPISLGSHEESPRLSHSGVQEAQVVHLTSPRSISTDMITMQTQRPQGAVSPPPTTQQLPPTQSPPARSPEPQKQRTSVPLLRRPFRLLRKNPSERRNEQARPTVAPSPSVPQMDYPPEPKTRGMFINLDSEAAPAPSIAPGRSSTDAHRRYFHERQLSDRSYHGSIRLGSSDGPASASPVHPSDSRASRSNKLHSVAERNNNAGNNNNDARESFESNGFMFRSEFPDDNL